MKWKISSIWGMKKMNSSDNREKAIYDYLDFLNKNFEMAEHFVTKERIDKNLEGFGEAINTFLTYPDILADIMTPKSRTFSMFFLQRMVLRSMSRSVQSYHTFTRGFSKSFLAFYSRYVHTMLVPRHKSFVIAGTKEQAAQIAKEKVIGDLWVRFPLLENEMQKFRVGGQIRNPFTQGQGYAEFRFSHGGIFDVVGGTIRGFRRNSGIFEEVIQLDPEFINEHAIPLLNKPREDIFGNVNPLEPHGSKIFITTAGYQGTYAHDKLLETLCQTAVNPDRYMVLGGSYKIPIMHGLLQESSIRDLLSAGSYERSSFEREYESIWSGARKGSIFSASAIQRLRKITNAEYKYREDSRVYKMGKPFYVVSADMSKDGSANTAVVVVKVIPREYYFTYNFVNLFSIDTSDYEKVSNILKKTIMNYKASMLIYDAAGIGASLRDWINKDSVDEYGTRLSGLGIINPPTKVEGDIIKWPKDKTICYEIKATGEKADEIHKIFFSRISNGSVRFLVKSTDAIAKFQEMEGFKKASNQKRMLKLRPYLFMDKMEKELRNLQVADLSDNMSVKMKVTRRDTKIQKDFFSAAEYAIFGVNQHIELQHYKSRRKSRVSAKDLVFMD